MANLKEIRTRITSVNSTRQITSAMKMVSAAKLRRAQQAIVQMRPYAEKLSEILSNLTANLDASEGVYSQKRDVSNVLIVPITSNRGLCGAFNAFIIRKTKSLVANEFAGKSVTLLPIGKKADDAFKKTELTIRGTTLPRNTNEVYDNLDFEHVAPIAEAIMAAYRNKQFDHIVLVYNKFKNAATQELKVEQFLPVLPPETKEADAASKQDYIFEPDRGTIVESLIPKSLKTQLYKALLDSYASEHGARMTAMHKATDNATDLLKDLKLTYNKARQTAITTEILEIVGGAEALNG